MKRFNKKKILIVLESIIALLILACGLYVSDYYHADRDAITAFRAETELTKQVLSDDTIVYAPENAAAGFIFYPGGKVEHNAYEPLMEALAEKNILTVLVEMPFNLAVFDINAADGIQSQYPGIKHWYIGGHSLGGVMASSYLKDNLEDYEGLILLGSYSTADLSNTSLEVLSIYGSEDQVLNAEKYRENKVNLPESYVEVILEGGNHAQFGMYGPQSGDGTASISNTEQIELTAQHIKDFILAKQK